MKTKLKLKVSRETLRRLDTRELGEIAAGGHTNMYHMCSPSGFYPCDSRDGCDSSPETGCYGLTQICGNTTMCETLRDCTILS